MIFEIEGSVSDYEDIGIDIKGNGFEMGSGQGQMLGLSRGYGSVDGYRGVYIHGKAGHDRGKGFGIGSGVGFINSKGKG